MFNKGDTGPDIGAIYNAVEFAAALIGVDERVIFAVIMQESHGDVDVVTTVSAAASGPLTILHPRREASSQRPASFLATGLRADDDQTDTQSGTGGLMQAYECEGFAGQHGLTQVSLAHQTHQTHQE